MSEELIKRLREQASVLRTLWGDASYPDADLMDSAAEALSRPAPAASAPQGFVVVPDAVIYALRTAKNAFWSLSRSDHGTMQFREQMDEYQQQMESALAMLSAAPAAPVAPGSNVYGPGSATSPAAEHMLATGAFPATVALSVWYGPMPESNGKTNWTAVLVRDGDVSSGYTFARSEYEDRVRYEADYMRFLIGETSEAPDLLDYDDSKHSGYVAHAAVATEAVAQGGVVDVEKVMAAVEEYADASHAERIDAIGIGGCEASRIRAEIRALLTAAPAGVGGMVTVRADDLLVVVETCEEAAMMGCEQSDRLERLRAAIANQEPQD